MSRGILPLPSVIDMSTLIMTFPAYQFRMVIHGDRRRYEAVRRRGAGGPIYCLISVSAREIYIVLSSQPAAGPEMQRGSGLVNRKITPV
jgi:hypothetical protein